MSLAPGAAGPSPLFCIINGTINYSLDNGLTWTASTAAATVTTSGVITGNGTAGSPISLNGGTLVTLGSDAATLPITGLGGLTAGGIRIIGEIITPSAGADYDYVVQINSTTTGYVGASLYVSGSAVIGSNVGSFGAGAITAGFGIARAGFSASRDRISFDVRIWFTAGTRNLRYECDADAFASATGANGFKSNTTGTLTAARVGAGGVASVTITTASATANAVKQNSFAVWQPLGLTA